MFLLMQCHCSIEHFFSLLLSSLSICSNVKKNKTKHGYQDHLFQLNCWNVPDRCFCEEFHNVARVGNIFTAADRSDQWLFFWCCRPNRTLKSAHGSPFFCVFRVGFSRVCVQNPPNHSWSTGTNCPGCCWTHPASASPCSITLAVCRPGQGG